jgi:putative ABC transport system permease protein
MLGVVIGVSSVAILVSMGQGLKNDISGTIEGLGPNLISVSPGNMEGGGMSSANPASLMSADTLTLKDVKALEKIKKLEVVCPLSMTAGTMKYGSKIASPMVVGAYPNIAKNMESVRVTQGRMFKSKHDRNVIVLGYNAKQELFGDGAAINKRHYVGRPGDEGCRNLGQAQRRDRLWVPVQQCRAYSFRHRHRAK